MLLHPPLQGHASDKTAQNDPNTEDYIFITLPLLYMKADMLHVIKHSVMNAQHIIRKEQL